MGDRNASEHQTFGVQEASIMMVVSLRPVSIIFDPKVTPQDATHIGNKYINTEDKIAC